MHLTSKDLAGMAEYSMVSNELRRKRPRSPYLDLHDTHEVDKPPKRQKLELDCGVVPPRPLPQRMTYPSPSPLQLFGSVTEPNVYNTGLKWRIPSKTINPDLFKSNLLAFEEAVATARANTDKRIQILSRCGPPE